MLFVRKTTPTVVVRDDSAARAEAQFLAEERGKASATVAMLGGLAAVVLLFLIGYFAWWAPMNAAEATQPPVQRETQIIERQVPAQPSAPTIINNPPIVHESTAPPTVIHEDHIVPVPVPDTATTTGGDAGSDTGSSDQGAGDQSTSGND